MYRLRDQASRAAPAFLSRPLFLALLLGAPLASASPRTDSAAAARRDPPASAPATQPSAPAGEQLIEDPSGRALDAFYARMVQRAGGADVRVRISHWGDSHVAPDLLTQRVRRLLQEQLGDAGPGFVLLGQPWRSYRHAQVKLGVTPRGRWRAERLWSRYGRRRPKPRDDLFGLAGISVHSRRTALAWLQPKRGVASAIDIYYLEQPRGGLIYVRAGGRLVQRIRTMAPTVGPGFARVELPPRTRRVELAAGGGEVRLFGADVVRADSGIVYDAFGINGARADQILRWNEPLLGAQLQRLAPDLIIVAYGSNEVDDEALTPESFARGFGEVLVRMRRLRPEAACLVLGPPDQARHGREQGWILPDKLDFVVDQQRMLAHRHRCAFWDQRAAMGGKGSIFRWVTADPPLARGDHVHLYSAGYLQLADGLHRALMAGLRRYRKRHGGAAAPASQP